MNRGEVWFRAATAATAIVLGACATDSETTPTNIPSTVVEPTMTGPTLPESAPIDEADAARRRELVRQWLGDTQAIVDTIDDPEAQQIVNLLKKAGIMAPYGNDLYQTVEPPKAPEGPFILPLLKEDASKGKGPEDLVSNENIVAVYNPELNAVILIQPAEISPVFRAIVTLHEGRHALEFTAQPYDWEDPYTFIEHEFTTHEFQNRVMAKIGGSAYEEFINKYAEEMASNIVVSGTKAGYPTRGEYRPELDTIFGPAVSQAEKDLRQTHIWIDGIFRAIDLYFGPGDTADLRKLDLLFNQYNRDSGIAPN